MLIKYNKKNVLSFPVKGASSNTVRLMPGLNEFPKDVYEAVKGHPQVKLMEEEGHIEFMTFKKEVVEEGEQVEVGSNDEELKLLDISEKDSKAAIKETFNLDLLERWLAEETRVKVKKALEKKIEKINKPTPN